MSARTLPKRVLEAIRRHEMWQPSDPVLLAVSGGMDSTVLLHVLAELAPAHKGQLAVASVDHGLRPEAAEEVAAVGRAAADLGLRFHALRVDLPPGPNLAARARDARRVALVGVGIDRIATAHHRDDQAETVLFHLLRGAGTRGLRGMVAIDAPWCRPLLYEPREVLAEWARAHDLAWAEDPSNPTSQRGALRRLMPALDAIHGNASAALARTARILGREDALLDELTDAAWAELSVDGRVPRHALSQLPPALQLRVLRRLTATAAFFVRADHLEAILDGALTNGGQLELGGGWSLESDAGWLSLRGPPE
jgi:tRNA(Ile)-lysidine synthase